ncbi:MAG: hypothetical protein KF874_02750 [Rhizobiaceae bacterium]|nr:hypothetical protein [Rhizobiaceae bacterium]
MYQSMQPAYLFPETALRHHLFGGIDLARQQGGGWLPLSPEERAEMSKSQFAESNLPGPAGLMSPEEFQNNRLPKVEYIWRGAMINDQELNPGVIEKAVGLFHNHDDRSTWRTVAHKAFVGRFFDIPDEFGIPDPEGFGSFRDYLNGAWQRWAGPEGRAYRDQMPYMYRPDEPLVPAYDMPKSIDSGSSAYSPVQSVYAEGNAVGAQHVPAYYDDENWTVEDEYANNYGSGVSLPRQQFVKSIHSNLHQHNGPYGGFRQSLGSYFDL